MSDLISIDRFDALIDTASFPDTAIAVDLKAAYAHTVRQLIAQLEYQATNKVTVEIHAERVRQISKEGYAPEHDDDHDDDSIAMAAACYAAPMPIFANALGEDDGPPLFNPRFEDAWPWAYRHDKRSKHDRRKQLIIAAPLIVAEIERLDRNA